MRRFSTLSYSAFIGSGSLPAVPAKTTVPGSFGFRRSSAFIEDCQFGLNDLSAVDLDAITRLPRFNMPLELGLFPGCKRFGPNNQGKKRTLVLDSDQYRYRAFISDIAGQDIRAHRAAPERAITAVRDWLRTASGRTHLPGGAEIVATLALEPDQLTFLDLSTLIANWLRTRP
jgi:hypothetical protein